MQKLRVAFSFLAVFVAVAAFSLESLSAQGNPHVLSDIEKIYLAKIISVKSTGLQNVPNTDTTAIYQTVTALVIKGEETGKELIITDSTFPMSTGDKVYVKYLKTHDGSEYYSIQEPYRLPQLFLLAAIFIIAVLIFGGKQGFLALLALFVSFGGIFNFLFPQILHGGNIVAIATTGALLSLFVVMYFTHGFTRLTTSAFLGCTLSVLVTLILAKYAVGITSLTGFSDEESVFLNIATKGNLDFVALLIGGIIIGVIGVIDDVSITQASVVNELLVANKNLKRKELYAKALNVGKDHMGAVINTLILAYTGASLPLVLLLYTTDTSVLELINREVIATEIVRSVVGSVGLLLAVPLTTLIAVFLMQGKEGKGGRHTHPH